MLNDQQLDRYADVLLWGIRTARTRKYNKNDIVLIQYDLSALGLCERLFEKILDAGMHPVQRINAGKRMEKSFYEHASARQLEFHPPGQKELYHHLNASIHLLGPESITHLAEVDPKKIARALISRKPLRDILTRREEEGFYGWTLCMSPTGELARHARMSLKEYAGQIARACFLDSEDPVAQWKEIHKNAGAIKKWLNRMKVQSYRVESKSTDLVITPGEKRRWIGISGHNIPSFELFMSPDWRGTEGIYFADQPSFRNGNYVEQVRLEFKKGAVVSAEAMTGENFLKTQLAMDKGANKLGEFSLTDIRFSKIDRFMANTLYDENFGGAYGNCHVAVGASYSDTYDGDPKELTPETKKALGFNDSALHWDLVNTEPKRVSARLVSGRTVVIYENGKFAC